MNFESKSIFYFFSFASYVKEKSKESNWLITRKSRREALT